MIRLLLLLLLLLPLLCSLYYYRLRSVTTRRRSLTARPLLPLLLLPTAISDRPTAISDQFVLLLLVIAFIFQSEISEQPVSVADSNAEIS